MNDVNKALEAVGPENLPDLKAHVEALLAEAREQGADACEALAVRTAQRVQRVVGDQVDPLYAETAGWLGLAVYVDQRKAEVSIDLNDGFSPGETVSQALEKARAASSNPFTGLADAESMAWAPRNLDLYHDAGFSAEDQLKWARACDAAALAADERIIDSRGTSFSVLQHCQAYGNSHGFLEGYATSTFDLSCYVRSAADGIRRTGSNYEVQRKIELLSDPARIGDLAARRALSYLGGRSLEQAHTQAPVVFAPSVSAWLLAAFAQAINGKVLGENASFLGDTLGSQLFSDVVTIEENPCLPMGMGSCPFDNEGVLTQARTFVENGQLVSYALDAESARRFGLANTGNSIGNLVDAARNLSFAPGQDGQSALLAKMGRGVLLSEVRTPQLDLKTGEFSMRGIGFWVENGEVQYALNPFTVSGNLKALFKHIVAVGCDLEPTGRSLGRSILIEQLDVLSN